MSNEHLKVKVFVKPFVKKVLEKKCGNPVDLNLWDMKNYIRLFLLDSIKHPSKHYDYTIKKKYNYSRMTTVNIKLSPYEFFKIGHELTLTDQMKLNRVLQKLVKNQIYIMLDVGEKYQNKISERIKVVRKTLNLSEKDLSDYAIKKDYYRYRKKRGENFYT
ncbi:MAG: hypothetical protein PHR81_10215 [Bacteroidales bacterium]|jgi:hypothetical protein|nr:hypothetical protein [Bacteroidales bacterium]MDD4215175.1 hypothetical protein [Bacteroidales bacterium]